jgi:1D-myo-inositol 3-kinase
MLGDDHDYAVVGHVVVDVEEETGARSPGGTALYSGLQAARLGCRTLVITAGDSEELRGLLEPYAGEFDLIVQPRETTTTFLTSGLGLERRQRRAGWAGEIEDVGAIAAPIVHIAPVAHETRAIRAGSGSFVGVTPQGLIRRWDGDGAPAYVALDPALMPSRFDALVLDVVERTYCASVVDAAATEGIAVAVTAGADGVELVNDGTRLPAIEPVTVAEDLGAGDVFSAVFFVALHEGRDAIAAAQLGQQAAAIRLVGRGPGAVGWREQIYSGSS